MDERTTATGKATMTASETASAADEATLITGEPAKGAPEPTLASGEPAKAAPERATRASQDKAIADELDEAATLIEELAANPARRAKIGKKGLSDAQLATGRSLHAAAQASFNARQSGMGEAEDGFDAAQAEEKRVKKDYADFRIALRQVVKAPADRTLLGLDGAAPTDRQRLVTQARASYAEAKKPRWRAVLDEEGYDEKTLDALLTALTSLDVQTAAARTAADAAKLATTTRNADARALRAWVVRIKTLERRNG